MGNFLFSAGGVVRKETTIEKDEARIHLIGFIKKHVRLDELPRLVDDYNRDYAPNNLLNREQFSDTFCSILNVTDVFYEIIADSRGQADFYMAMVALVLFSIGDFEEKISFLFQMFNTNGGEDMDRKEMGKFFFCSISGLCKICNLPSPSQLGMQDFLMVAFREVDKDGGGSVNFEEFQEWLSNHDII
jgi:hypothetical protein